MASLDSILSSLHAPGSGKRSRFHSHLLWITGITQLGDAQALLVMAFLETQIPCAFPTVTASDINALTTSVFVGMLLGALGGGLLADKHGRRFVYLLMTAAVGGFSLLSSLVTSFWSLVACRLGVGLGLGAAPAALSLYAEFLPSAARGANIMSFFMFFSVGAVIQAVVAWAALSTLPVHSGWRVMTGISSLPCLGLFLIALCGMVPESPRYLLSRGRVHEAQAVLQQVAATNGVKLNEVDLNTVTDSVSPSHTGRAKLSSQWRMLYSHPVLLRSLILLSLLFALMAVLYYVLILLTNVIVVSAATGRTGPSIFGCIPMESADFALAVFVNSAEVPGLLVAQRMIDRVGRRKTVSYMFIACGVCTGLLLLLLGWGGGSSASNTASIVILFLARTTALGFNQSLWVLSCEAFPTPVRGVGLGIATSFARIGGGFAPSICTVFGNDLLGALTVCTCVAGVAAGLVRLFPHETADADLDEPNSSSNSRFDLGVANAEAENEFDALVKPDSIEN